MASAAVCAGREAPVPAAGAAKEPTAAPVAAAGAPVAAGLAAGAERAPAMAGETVAETETGTGAVAETAAVAVAKTAAGAEAAETGAGAGAVAVAAAETEAETEAAAFADLDVRDVRPPVPRPPRAATRGQHGSGPRTTRGAGGSEAGLIPERDLRALEKEHPDGLTSVQVVDFFTRRGIRFSEATFRKYVQQGLLPRSRRVGRKGKHQGSLGLYPASTVRRINVIKRLQSEDHTIEEIQRRFLRFREEIEALERSLETLFAGFEEELARPQFDAGARKALKKDVGEAQLAAEELVKLLESIERRVAAPAERPPGGTPGGAEDLL